MGVFWGLRHLQENFSKAKIYPIYFLFGEEPYLLNESLKLIRKEVLKAGLEDFNFDHFICPEAKVEDVCQAARTFPVMAPHRLVIFREVQGLSEKAWESFFPVIKNPLEKVCLVFVSQKVDKRKKSFKQLQKSAVMVELKAPFENQMAPWIQYIADQEGLVLSQEGVALIHEACGNELSFIQGELKKIKQFVGDEKQVSLAVIKKMISSLRVANVFEFTDAIGNRDAIRAISLLSKLIEQGERGLGVLAMTLRHLRILSALRVGHKQGLRGRDLSLKAGVSPYFLERYMGQVRKWDEAKILKTLRGLYELDSKLKTSSGGNKIYLEEFVLRTCSEQELASKSH